MINTSVIIDPEAEFSATDSRRTALIFKTELLPYTQTFITGQAGQLNRYQPVYVGLSRVSNGGLPLPSGQVEVLDTRGVSGGFRQRIYRATGYAPEFIQRLRNRTPALIHAHFAPCGLTAVPIARALDIPLIVTGHGHDVTAKGRIERFANRFGFRYSKYQRLINHPVTYIAVSKFIKDRMVARGFPSEKIVVHYTGIDVEAFRPSPENKREKVVLFVGRFVEKKGAEYLVRAIGLIQNRHPDLKLVLIGDGPLRGELRQLAAVLNVNAEFLGVQSADVVQSWMRRSSMYVFPSVTANDGDSEGLGMVLLEAMASGLPIVAHRHGPVPEAVIDGETGLLVPERDVAQMAHAIVKYLDNPDFLAQVSRRGRVAVCQNFDIRRQTTALEKIYDDAISDHLTRNAKEIKYSGDRK